MSVASGSAPALILWDIDQTLIQGNGIGREIYAAGFQALTGRALEVMPDLAGRTEYAIVEDVLAFNGEPESSREAFYVELERATEKLGERMREIGRALPGAREALAALAAELLVQSVATGNIRPIAEAKLTAFGLSEHLDVAVGGYGSDDRVRATLVRRARERATAKYDCEFASSRVVVVGDTPHDVRAAQDNGAWSIGVATGGSSVAVLADAGADVVLSSLADTSAVVDVVAGLLR
ncbi:MAG TPA: haloacid dehalogenase-like hydrolase [Acidimicrobiales bacterium]